MRYYKLVQDGYIVRIGSGFDATEISEEEYNDLLELIRSMPEASEGFTYKLKEDLTWELIEAPIRPKSEIISTMELLSIVIGDISSVRTEAAATAMRAAIEVATQSLDDEIALQVVSLFAEWDGNGHQYEEGDRFQFGGILYTVKQPHISQPDWPPTTAVSLYSKVLIPDSTKIYDWEQPDSTNGYDKGAVVRHVGKVWESDQDNNVFEPGTVGAPWHEIPDPELE